MIFATPHFGAGGIIIVIVLGIALAMLAAAVAAVVRGMMLLQRPDDRDRRKGRRLILAGVLVPVACYFAPGVLFRVTYGSPPRTVSGLDIKAGMSADDVRGLLGEPHSVGRRLDRVCWWYCRDAIGIDWLIVEFGPDDRVFWAVES